MESEALAQELICHINHILAGTSSAPELSVGENELNNISELEYEGTEKKDAETQTASGYWCHLCSNRTYITKYSLQRHLDSYHSQIRFACLHCDATYSRRSDLKKHGTKLHKKNK